MMPIEQKKEIPAAWREFAAGMEFLRRYGVHNTANSGAISRDNLRLLHRALLQDNEYRQLITDARRKTPQLTGPDWSTLTASRQLHAHLVSIPAKNSIRLTTQPGYLGMFLILSGSAETFGQPETPSRHSWWPRGWLSSRQTHTKTQHLKANDIVCVTHGTSSTGLLVTGKKACVILAVFNSLQNRQPQPAAYVDGLLSQQIPLHTAS
ncbi:MAG TPA: hypothetical protein ENH21_04080 [Chromatiales bacterium]|nr:hypothetical protein [Chromatiales bacterium]HEX22588.1 hypothetical protein [Chromatiales bacterium]